MGNLNSPKLMKYLSGELDKELCGKKWMWEVDKVEVDEKKVVSEVEAVSIPVEKVVEPIVAPEKSKLDLDWDMVMDEVVETAGLEKPGEEKPVYAQSVDMSAVGISTALFPRGVQNQQPKPRTKRLNLQRERTRNKNAQNMTQMFGFVGHGQYMWDIEAARKLCQTKDVAKPKWAVYGLCMLRDGGVCQVCGELLYTQNRVKQWEVIKKTPARDCDISGGAFSELNCVTVCIDCFKVYNPRKNFFGSFSYDESWIGMRLYMLKRRNERRGGCSVLTEVGEKTYSELRRKKQRMVDDREIIGNAVLMEHSGLDVDDKLRELFKNYK